MLLIDEIYTGHDKATEKYFLNRNSLCNIILRCRRCWIAYVSLGNQDVFGSPLSEIIVRHFVIHNMNVIFRSAHHISAFSNNFIHTRKPITGSTALITGCYTSSQLKIEVTNFCKSELFAKLDKTWSSLSKKYADSQIVVVFTPNEQKNYWRIFIDSQEEVASNCAYILDPEVEFYKLPFGGLEAMSVLIIIDVDCSNINTMTSITSAITRAQYEVVLCVNDEHKESLKSYMDKKPIKYLGRLENLPQVKEFTKEKLHEEFRDDDEMHLLVQGVVNLERLPSLLSFIESFSDDHKEKFAMLVFKTFAHRRRVVQIDFLNKLEELMGSHIVDSVTRALETNSLSDLRGRISKKCGFAKTLIKLLVRNTISGPQVEVARPK